MSQIHAAAASARESSRRLDGRFGAQGFDRAALDLDPRPGLVSEHAGEGAQLQTFDALEASLDRWQDPTAVRDHVEDLPAAERHRTLDRMHSRLVRAQEAVAVAMNEAAAASLSARAARDAPPEAVALAVVADYDDAQEREEDTWRRIELVDASGRNVTDGWTALEEDLSDAWMGTVSRDELTYHQHQGIVEATEARAGGRFSRLWSPGAPIDTARLIPITGRGHGHGLDAPWT